MKIGGEPNNTPLTVLNIIISNAFHHSFQLWNLLHQILILNIIPQILLYVNVSDFFIPSVFQASEHLKNLFSAIKSYCFLYFRAVAIIENPLDNPFVVALPVKSIEIGVPKQCFSKL